MLLAQLSSFPSCRARIVQCMTEGAFHQYLAHQPFFIQWIEKSRLTISHILASSDSYGIFRHLILNESSHQLSMFHTLGFVHLSYASGIHMLALIHALAFLTKHLLHALKVPIVIALPLYRVASCLMITYFWLLTGARPGLLRVIGVLALRQTARFLGWHWHPFLPLTLIFLLDGMVSTSQGRIVWFLAVAGSSLFTLNHVSLACVSWSAVALYEGLIHPYSALALATPLLSLITIPMISLVYVPSCFLLLFHQSPAWLVLLATKTIGFLAEKAHMVGNLWILPRSSLLIALALFLTSALVAEIIGKWKRQILACTLLACIPLRGYLPKERRHFTIEQINVGQGDSALISSEKGAGLIDTGMSMSDATWLRFFIERNISELSWIALTHLDRDHSGGIKHLEHIIQIKCIASSVGERLSARGQRFTLTSLHDCIPYPTFDPKIHKKKANGNMAAVFIPLPDGGFYLSAGDASAHDELAMIPWIKNQKTMPGPKILKISHHGSKYSSSQKFLESLQPDIAWISVGKNHYGHPSAEVLERLSHIPVHRTDREGSLRYESRNEAKDPKK